MAHPAYIREKARELRVERRLSIVEIAERLALPKTTVFYWVRDLPLQRPRRANAGQRKGNRGMPRKYRELREAAYAEGRDSFQTLCASDPTFRDFVCMYIGEGYKRSRNAVQLSNSDPRVIVLATRWLRALSGMKLRISVQYHLDQDPENCRSSGPPRSMSITPTSECTQKGTVAASAGAPGGASTASLRLGYGTRCSEPDSRRGWIACRSSG